jgi:hypothetical protein
MQDAYTLFDMLMLQPNGITYEDIFIEMGWSRGKIIKTVQVLRDLLSQEYEKLSVTCDPDPDNPNGPWLYVLRAGERIVSPEDTTWTNNRIDDLERRIVTIKHVLDAAVRDTDGRTITGRKARKLQLHLGRALEDLGLLDGEAD